MSFIDLFDKVTSNLLNSNETSNSYTCESEIPDTSFHFWLLIPATCLIIIQAFTLSRKSKLLNCCYGRPGVIFPMDILGSSNRLSYVAAWGSIAYLAAEMVVDQKFAIKLSEKYGIVFNAMLSMIIYGIDYFPLFAVLAVESVLGYVFGTLYAWMLFAVNVYEETECHVSTYQARLIMVLRDLPYFLCLGYLSVSLSVRLIQASRRHSLRFFHASEMVSILHLKKELDSTTEAAHVRKLLKKPQPERNLDATVHSKIVGFIRRIIHDYVYHRKKNFRYSNRLLSVMFVGALLLYKVTIEIVVFILSVLSTVQKGFDATLIGIGLVYQEGETSMTSTVRTTTLTLCAILDAAKICFILSATVACASGYLTILHMLSRHRLNLFALYKGDTTFIPHRSTRGNASLLVDCMRYAGYQVGYIAWGFIIQFTILFLFTFANATLITLIGEGFYNWILSLLDGAWPAVLVTIFIQLTQYLLAKLLFLQGDDLAIDNRRVLFCTEFFFFFYNVFLGLLSCLVRILKSIVIGSLFMSRLDHSALSRRFEMMDPGFAAYVGFIQIESTHTNPVMLVFLRALMIDGLERDTNQSTDDTAVIVMEENEKSSSNSVPRTQARNRWQLMYTLYNNPGLRIYRKHYMTFIKDMRTRLTENCNLNNSNIDNVTEGMAVAMKKNKISVNLEMSSHDVMDFSKILTMAQIFNNLSQSGFDLKSSNNFHHSLADEESGMNNNVSISATGGRWKLAAGRAYLKKLENKNERKMTEPGRNVESTHI